MLHSEPQLLMMLSWTSEGWSEGARSSEEQRGAGRRHRLVHTGGALTAALLLGGETTSGSILFTSCRGVMDS